MIKMCSRSDSYCDCDCDCDCDYYYSVGVGVDVAADVDVCSYFHSLNCWPDVLFLIDGGTTSGTGFFPLFLFLVILVVDVPLATGDSLTRFLLFCCDVLLYVSFGWFMMVYDGL